MPHFSNIKLKPKLILTFLTVGIVPLIVASWLSYQGATQSLAQANTTATEALDLQVTNQFTAVRELKRAGIESYFQTISDQMRTFSENRMVVNAMRDFTPAFRTYASEAKIGNVQQHKQALRTYYTNKFANEYKTQNNGKQAPISAMFNPLDDESIVLQHAYIHANTHPLGEKHKLNRASDNTQYNRIHNQVHPVILSYLEKFGYYDIFLVDIETGDIVYSVFKELDYSTSLKNGPYAKTNFAKAFQKASQANQKDAVVLVDFEPYGPSYEAPASFIASPIFDGNQKIGVAVFQMPLDRITQVMSDRSGLGKTGETYLVGSDFLMRSDTHHDPEHRSVIASFRHPEEGKVETESVSRVFKGESGVLTTQNYAGKTVLSAYTPVNIEGITWALIAEIAASEAFAATHQLKQNTYAAQSQLLLRALLVGGLTVVIVLLIALTIAQMIAKPVTELAKVATQVSEGNINQKITYQAKDEIGTLSQAFKKSIETLHNLIEEIQSLSQEAQNGRLSQRGNTNRFQGAYASVISGINTMLDDITNPIDESAKILARVAQKDLSSRVEGNYKGDHAKIKESLNTAIQNLSDSFRQLATASQQVDSASGEISAGSQTLAQGASNQAASLEEVSASLNELESMTKQNAQNARQAKGVSDTAQDAATKGKESMQRLSQAIDKIKTSSDETAKIINTIDEIAFQTNLLALNAAVEAARAGEAGKGFAVVAEEVRNLAMRSAQAAKDTASLIEGAVKDADEGVTFNKEVLNNFEQIDTFIHKNSVVMTEIAEGSEQQREGLTEITTAIGQLNQITQQNAANAEESASAAEELSAQATEMQALSAEFTLSNNQTPNKVPSHASHPATNSEETQKAEWADAKTPLSLSVN